MKKSKNYFKHIYIERAVIEHQITKIIISKFKNSVIIPIENYLEIFGRKKQSFLLQKDYPSLILARKQTNFLYPNPPYCQNFGFERSFYASLVLNCIFDCKYCFLQGMYPSANIVVFVNIEDLLREIEFKLKDGSFQLFLSYDTDLLALENITGFIRKTYFFAKNNSNLIIEIRTKSNNFSVIEDLNPIPNVVLAWSILPNEMIKKFEIGTPLLNQRITAIRRAIEKGWKVRICFDPIILTKDCDVYYEKMLKILSKAIDLKNIHNIAIGNFRMNKTFFKKIASIRPEILMIERNNIESFEKISEKIKSFFIDKKIYSLYN